MLRPRQLLAAMTTLLAITAAAACGAPNAEQPTGPQAGERVINHAMGQTSVKDTPQRVVVLDTGELDAVLSLGVTPVGAVAPDATNTLPPYLAGRARSVQRVGTIGSPNLEQIAALKPDLILSSKTRDADKYEQLSKIAPTVFAETVGKTWKENLLLDAEALGKKPQAEQLLADYHAKAEAVGKQAGDPSKLRVSTMRFVSGGNEIRLYGKGSFIGSILADTGFNRPENQQTDETFTEISREQVAQADGELLFHGSYSPAAKASQDQLVASQQWGRLNAVREGKAFEVADDRWFLGLGPIAANLVLDDLQRYLTQK